MTFDRYRLPDGRVVNVDSTASKGAQTIGFTLIGGTIVTATLVAAYREPCFRCDGDGFGPMGGNCPRCGGSGKEAQ
jgi:hypothetical protein